MKKRLLTVALSVALAISTFAGCGSSAAETQTSANNATNTSTSEIASTPESETPPSTEETLTEPQELIFWHSMGGSGGEALEKMVSDFNNSQDYITVTPQFQGNYDDAVTKLQSVIGTDAAPDIMQLYDIGTRWMIDSGYSVPMQELIDSENWDVAQIEPNIAGYYTVDGTLHSMPFNSSTPIMYYNKDAFRDAGLDPDTPPANWDELEEYSQKLTHTEDGETFYGFTLQVYGWFFEQYLSKQGLTYANNGNGRDAVATVVDFDQNGGGTAFLTRWNDLYQKGLVGNLGRDGDACINSFGAGKTYMIFGSTASINTVLSAVGGDFELGTGFLPDLITGTNGGVSIGGGSLWMVDKGSDDRKTAAWEFIKFMVSPEQQVYWHQQTGYFPISVKAYDLPEMQEHLEANPLFQTAIDQLHASPVEARGALLGVFTEARQTVEKNIEMMLDGSQTPEDAVSSMATSINSSIEKYNIANS